jgi:CDP-diacylglycerol--glycerol-3-phosphate 3-phosphatidyltransferase
VTLATWITLFRIFLVPVFLGVLLTAEQVPYRVFLAAAIFVLAAATDGLDGYVARARREETKFGALIDPIADKLLVSSALIALVELDQVSAWVVVIIIGREFAVSGLRLVAASEGQVIAASIWGKLKTMTQIVAITGVLIGVPGANALLWIAAVVTVLSGVDYFLKAQFLFR